MGVKGMKPSLDMEKPQLPATIVMQPESADTKKKSYSCRWIIGVVLGLITVVVIAAVVQGSVHLTSSTSGFKQCKIEGFLFETPTETPTTTATTTTTHQSTETPTTTSTTTISTPQCVWYGQCGHGWNNGKLNCPATDVTKHPPLLTDPKGLGLLKTLCPEFYVDGTHTRTCCDTLQLQTISDSVEIVQQILSQCPACLKNFMNEICYTVCSVNQSQFMWANVSAPKPPAYTTGIPSVTYIFTEQYAQSLFDSCKDVQIPTMHEKALSLLCGISAKNCTPHVWLDYMGSISNGQAPFPINYIFSNTTWISPDKRTLTPLDVDNLDCDDPKFGCSPTDCRHTIPVPVAPPPSTIPVPVAPPPTEKTRQEYFTKLFGSGYNAIEVKISRKDSTTEIKHDFPPPSINSIMFTAMYDRQFMQQVLTLQLQVAEVQAGGASGPISLSDVCTVQQGDCVTESTMQYWENNATAVDLVIHDEWGFYALADYLDHYLSCVKNPNSTWDGTRLFMKCLSTFDGPTLPWIVLEGYDSSNYENANAFVITYILKNDPNTSAWQAAAMNFLASYNNPNMTITSRRINNGDSTTPQCVWYGQCGQGWNNGKLNCPATDVTKHPPLLTDPKGLGLLKTLCPELYVDDTHTRTCCDTLQLQTIWDNMGIVQQVLSRCPACWNNFMNEICYTVCSVNQSQFMWANFSAEKSLEYTTGIPSVTYIFTEQYAQSLFDSCKDVQWPAMHDHAKALSRLCGRRAKDCTPQLWLEYMGSIRNGQTPFPINYIFSNTTWISPDKRTLTPLDLDNFDCDDPKFGCFPADCGHTIPLPVAPPPTEKTRQEYFTKLFGSGYDAIEVKISRKDNATKIKHNFPPPSHTSIMFTAMYDRQFMQQVLTLQLQVAEVQAGGASGPISLSDVCTVQQGDCVTESTLQYWENNATALDLVIYGEWRFFMLADYLEHYLSCVKNPNSTVDGTWLNMTCLSTFDGPTLPWIVLEGYDGSNYQNATAFVITYILKNDPNTPAWQAAAMNFLASYNNPNMTITSRRINNPAMTAADVKPNKPLVFVADSKSGVFDEVVTPHDFL